MGGITFSIVLCAVVVQYGNRRNKKDATANLLRPILYSNSVLASVLMSYFIWVYWWSVIVRFVQ